MKNKNKSLKVIIDNISKKKVIGKQEKNKLWWEALPMTYEDWDQEDRMPKSKSDFLRLERNFLNSNPFLRDKFDFSTFKGKKILEIGCGSGAASCLFAREGANVIAVDITKEGVNMAKKNAGFQKLKIRILQADAEKMDFPDESFDYVFSWGALHHSQDTIKTFKEVSRVLRKGGYGLIMVYNKNSLRYYLNGLNWLILKRKIFEGYNLERVQDFYTDGYYHRHFTSAELRKELEKQGLKYHEIIITHMGTRMIPFLPRFIVQWLKDHFGWLLVIKFKKE
jgi:ubiquinone/menaquinone biosynthesis C-methylase UbiE